MRCCAGMMLWAMAVAAHAETIRYAAVLTGGAEVPSVSAPGKGRLSAELDMPTRVLHYRLAYSGLTGPADGAHVHGPAGPRANAPHLIMLGMGGRKEGEHHDMPGMGDGHAMLASPLVGSATLTDAQIADLNAGRWYVNVHTRAHPAGEIRGQVHLLR